MAMEAFLRQGSPSLKVRTIPDLLLGSSIDVKLQEQVGEKHPQYAYSLYQRHPGPSVALLLTAVGAAIYPSSEKKQTIQRQNDLWYMFNYRMGNMACIWERASKQ
ncbi:hypothetical protein NC653_022382 [Populus alba x Populus x berolinensis]|uniref:Uncharacterized protein n=1 Tax=Populus alba x Populus x berolinensis TaxID=444605 RepID=A0AAD6MEM1_9ROSI|nr:hypothetical protein NC653_022382 [Populus alba x Populus x berolinensis]